MTSLYSPSLGVQTQTPGSSSRPNTAQFVNNSGQVNAQYGGSRQQQLNRWIEEQLKEQEAAAAEKKAAEEAAAAAEQAAAEQAAFEAQKQAYKDDADVVFELESPGFADLSEVLGVDSNDDMFVEVKGDLVSTWIVAGGGNDVIYFGDNQNLFYKILPPSTS